MPEWRGWKECERLVVRFKHDHGERRCAETYEDVLVAVSNGLLTIKRGADETYIFTRQLEGWRMHLREHACATCKDGQLTTLFNDPDDINAPSVAVECPACGRLPNGRDA